MSGQISDAWDVLAEVIADKVVERLRGGVDAGWTDQSTSPLGRRRHCAAVRRRIAQAQGGAAVVGRSYRLDAEALAQELTRGGKPAPEPEAVDDRVQQLRRKLGLVR